MEPSSELKYDVSVILKVWSPTCIILGLRLVAVCRLLGLLGIPSIPSSSKVHATSGLLRSLINLIYPASMYML